MANYFVDLAPTESVECTALSQIEEYINQVAKVDLAAAIHANELLPRWLMSCWRVHWARLS